METASFSYCEISVIPGNSRFLVNAKVNITGRQQHIGCFSFVFDCAASCAAFNARNIAASAGSGQNKNAQGKIEKKLLRARQSHTIT